MTEVDSWKKNRRVDMTLKPTPTVVWAENTPHRLEVKSHCLNLVTNFIEFPMRWWVNLFIVMPCALLNSVSLALMRILIRQRRELHVLCLWPGCKKGIIHSPRKQPAGKIFNSVLAIASAIPFTVILRILLIVIKQQSSCPKFRACLLSADFLFLRFFFRN